MNTHRASLFLAGVACATLFAGCKGTTTSDLLATGDIAATLDATDDGYGNLVVSASLEARTPDNENYVLLAGGDALNATYGKQRGAMGETEGGHYEASFPISNVGDVTVSFDRAKGKDAPGSYGVMPESVELPDFGGAVISRGLDDVVLDLPETVGDKQVDLTGPCVSSLHYDVGQAADYLTIYAGDLYASYAQDECDVTVTVTTVLYGDADPALNKASTFTLRRVRSASFYSVP
jgi:hypothetical protein